MKTGVFEAHVRKTPKIYSQGEGPGRKIRDSRNIGIYSAGRYIALTGNRYRKAPAELEVLILV